MTKERVMPLEAVRSAPRLSSRPTAWATAAVTPVNSPDDRAMATKKKGPTKVMAARASGPRRPTKAVSTTE
jgi:hypothetical protein